MPQCQAYKAGDLLRCTTEVRDLDVNRVHGILCCGVHLSRERNAGPRVAHECCYIPGTTGRRCIRDRAEGSELCENHATRPVLRQQRAARQRQRLFDAQANFEENRLDAIHRRLLDVFNVFEPPRRERGLGDLARNAQNVHTTEVNRQMNDGLKKLLDFPVPDKQATLPQITAAFMTKLHIVSFGGMLGLLEDMNRWYTTRTCVTVDDWLYKRALDGLWARIQSEQDAGLQKELVVRLYQETWESKGMCCDGHLSRLVNVMVGFDNTFAPPVPVKEILQNKLGAISMLDVDTEEKIRQATELMDELRVPAEERSVWLEAF